MGAIAGGMARQGHDLSLERLGGRWRPTFYVAGMSHSNTADVGAGEAETPGGVKPLL